MVPDDTHRTWQPPRKAASGDWIPGDMYLVDGYVAAQSLSAK
jgi:hypothetical protein